MIAALTACSDTSEELPLVRTEIRLNGRIAPIETRSTDQTLQSQYIAKGRSVGVTITGAGTAHSNVEWTADENGALTPPAGSDKIYYGTDEATITAYHPYNSTYTENQAYDFSVQADQSTDGNYLASDLLWVKQEVSPQKDAVALTFKHLLSKVNIKLSGNVPESAKVYICGTKLNATFNPCTGTISEPTGDEANITAAITSNSGKTASAIVLPGQTVTAGTLFIKIVEMDNGAESSDVRKTFYYWLSEDVSFQAGYSYTFNVEIKKDTTPADL